MLSDILVVLLSGLSHGFILALLGVGITLIFGLGEILNLAHGPIAIFAAVVALLLFNNGVNLLFSILLGVCSATILALVIDKSLLTFVYRFKGEERILTGIFVTLGFSFFLDGILYPLFPFQFSVPLDFPSIHIWGSTVDLSTIVSIIVCAVVLLVVHLFLNRTYLGKAARTVVQDETGSVLCGINPRNMRTLIFVLSSFIAGVVGIVYGTAYVLSVAKGFELTILALIVSIVGGVKSVSGAVWSGILIGLVIAFGNFFIGSYTAMILVFMVAVFVLLIKGGLST